MRIISLEIKNFRCFTSSIVQIDAPFNVFLGKNGSGKSTILEALHYGCYLRSFRTAHAKELIAFGKDAFFLKLVLAQDDKEEDILEIGFSGNQRLLKINGKKVTSYKELLDSYRVITVTEDDLMLIKGGPEQRRAFIDSAVMLHDPAYIHLLKEHKAFLAQRNSLLYLRRKPDLLSYEIWTEKLWVCARTIAQKRVDLLKKLEQEVNILGALFFSKEHEILVAYISKKDAFYDSWDLFSKNMGVLAMQEEKIGRSCFGAHLDDFSLIFKDASLQRYASRGQQKLIVLLIKIAQFKLGIPTIFLLDDFITDLDPGVLKKLLALLASLKTQIFITAPHAEGSFFEEVTLCHASFIYV